jgi:hypothetical protein
MAAVITARSRVAAYAGKGVYWLRVVFLACVFLAAVVPITLLVGQGTLWYFAGGPPLDFDAPHNGQVVAHIDVLGAVPPDIARIRISEVAGLAVVWDVKPLSNRTECWNACWNLIFKVGPNPASFTAGHQPFTALVPLTPTFSLSPGTTYLFEVWDSKGRVAQERFTL